LEKAEETFIEASYY